MKELKTKQSEKSKAKDYIYIMAIIFNNKIVIIGDKSQKKQKMDWN